MTDAQLKRALERRLQSTSPSTTMVYVSRALADEIARRKRQPLARAKAAATDEDYTIQLADDPPVPLAQDQAYGMNPWLRPTPDMQRELEAMSRRWNTPV